MKKIIFAIAALLLATPAWADPTPAPAINTAGLTPDQMAQIQTQADTMRADSPEAQTTKTEAARTLGVAVNDFASTPVGQLTMWMIIWKIAGHDFLGIIMGVAWFALMIPLWVRYFKRICLDGDSVETFDKDTGKLIKRETEALSLRDGDVAGYRFTMAVALAGICIAGFIMIF